MAFWLKHKETGLPLVTNDSSITTYPPGSVKLVNIRGDGWSDTRRDSPPNGYGFSFVTDGYAPPPNDTLFYYLHFLTTGDVDTIKARKILYEYDCQQVSRFEYFYNDQAVPIDSSKNVHTPNLIDFFTLYKQP
ncbi:MAG: hypothetical protein LPK21_10730 [Hymenobacteraceae bacterium]|nr:hypothetical protein [Hymenobacteraceae bacterium]